MQVILQKHGPNHFRIGTAMALSGYGVLIERYKMA